MTLKKRNFVILFIVSVFMLLIMVGCSQTKDNLEKASVSYKELSPVTLKFFLPDSTDAGINIKPDQQLVLDNIEQKSPLNINLEFTTKLRLDYWEELEIKLAANEIDVFLCNLWFKDPYTSAKANFYNMIQAGYFKDIKSLLPEYAPNLNRGYTQGDLEFGTLDGKLVVLPPQNPMALSTYAIVREDFMKKYKIPEIKTLDDFGVYLKTVKEHETGIAPGYNTVNTYDLLRTTSDYLLLYPLENLLAYKADQPDKIILAEKTAEFRKIVDTLSVWQRDGYLFYNQTSEDIMPFDLAIREMGKGTISSALVAPEINGTTAYSIEFQLKNVLQQNISYSDIKAYCLYPSHKAVRLDPITDSWGNGGGIAFNAKSSDENIQRALMFLDWVYSNQENYNMFMYGIEGKHYKMSDGQLDMPEELKNKTNPYIGWAGCFAFKNLEYELFPKGYPKNIKQSYMDYIKSDTIYAPLSGFYYDYKSIADIISERYKKFTQLIEYPLLYFGNYEYQKTDIYINEVTNANGETILKKAQSDLDNWIVKNKK